MADQGRIDICPECDEYWDDDGNCYCTELAFEDDDDEWDDDETEPPTKDTPDA